MIESIQRMGSLLLQGAGYILVGLVVVILLALVASVVVRACARAIYEERFRHLRKMLEFGADKGSAAVDLTDRTEPVFEKQKRK